MNSEWTPENIMWALLGLFFGVLLGLYMFGFISG